MVKSTTLLWFVGLSIFLSSFAVTAQTTDTLRRSYSGDLSRDAIFRLGRRGFSDTVRRDEFKMYNGALTEIADCDTNLQTFVYVRRPSPWRVGLFAGPNFAYCGTWQNTFGATPRDNTLYNGAGVNLTGNIDYFFSRPERKVRVGLGSAFGYQNYFTRDSYRDELFGLAEAVGINRSNVSIRQRASEDFFLTVGPVVTLDIARSRRYPNRKTYLEVAARGGVFRTQAATIVGFVPSQSNRLIRSVNPSTNLYHLGALGSVALFFPIADQWQVGVQGQGFITRLNYLIVNGLQDQLYEFERQHGGFSVGLAVRKNFNERRLIPKAPVTCPECDSIPVLSVQLNNQRINGLTLQQASLTNNVVPTISWRSTTLRPRNETFTARLHYKTPTADSVIAQVVNTTDTMLAFPGNFADSVGRPRPGFYYVTVHNRQEAQCGACMSEVAVSSFSFEREVTVVQDSIPCTYTNQLDRLEVVYRNPYTRAVANVCYCNGVITSVGDKETKLRYRTLNKKLASGTFSFGAGQPDLTLAQIPAELATLLRQEKQRIESGQAVQFKRRSIRPQVLSYNAVFTITQEPCNGRPAQTLGSFQTTISDETLRVINLKPISDEQRSKLLTPSATGRSRRR
jgi:hypothetical protein